MHINGDSDKLRALVEERKTSLRATHPQMTSEEVRAALDAFSDELLSRRIVDLYEQTFTPEQLSQINYFFASPVGKKLKSKEFEHRFQEIWADFFQSMSLAVQECQETKVKR